MQEFLNLFRCAPFFHANETVPSLLHASKICAPPWQHKQKSKPKPYHDIIHFGFEAED